MNKINYFKLNDDFWISLQNDIISFGFKGIPKNIHFTLSFNEKNEDINLHITKNSLDQFNKPQLKIFVINKKIILENSEQFLYSFLNGILEKIDVNDLRCKSGYQLSFVSLKSIEKSENISTFQNEIFEYIRKINKSKRKNRLKIVENIGEQFEQFANDITIQNLIINNKITFESKSENTIESGIILTENESYFVVKIGVDWFKIRNDLKPVDLISILVDQNVANYIINKITVEVKLIETFNTFEESKKFSNPIRLTKIKTI